MTANRSHKAVFEFDFVLLLTMEMAFHLGGCFKPPPISTRSHSATEQVVLTLVMFKQYEQAMSLHCRLLTNSPMAKHREYRESP